MGAVVRETCSWTTPLRDLGRAYDSYIHNGEEGDQPDTLATRHRGTGPGSIIFQLD